MYWRLTGKGMGEREGMGREDGEAGMGRWWDEDGRGGRRWEVSFMFAHLAGVIGRHFFCSARIKIA